MIRRPWDDDEAAWARECFLAGDDVEEIAAAADRTPEDVAELLGESARLTPRERDILSLYSSGCSYPEIAAVRGGSWKAAAATITNLRRKGFPIPHRYSGWGERSARPAEARL